MTRLKIKKLIKVLPALVVTVALGSLLIAGQALAAPLGPGDTSVPATNSTTTPATGAAAPTKTPATTSGCVGTSNAPTVSSGGANCITPTADPAIATTNTALITKYLNPFIKLLSILVGLAVTFGIIYGGIEYTMSAGDPQKAQKGRKHIQDAVLALVAYALIFAFLNFLIPGGIAV